MCRDLSSYLIALPCLKVRGGVTTAPSLAAGQAAVSAQRSVIDSDRDRDRSSQDAIMLMSAMDFMKLQICYFGNMALRSSLSFAILGSLLVAIVPVLVENDS